MQVVSSSKDSKGPRAGVVAACDLCRKRKVRCELQRPCKRCTLAGVTCQTTKFDRIRFNPDTVNQSPKRHKKNPNHSTSRTSTSALSTAPVYNTDLDVYAAAAPIPPTTTSPSSSASVIQALKAASEESATRSQSLPSSMPTMAGSRRPVPAAGQEWRSSLYLDAEGQIVIAGSISGLPMLEQLGALDKFDLNPSTSNKKQVPPGLRGGAGTYPVSYESFQNHGKQETDGVHEADDGDPMMTPLDNWALLTHTCPVDLLNSLIRLYLTKVEALFPILHHPSFIQTYLEASGADGEPEGCSAAFAGLLMAICAVTSRAIQDPRVFAVPDNPRSSGLQYFQLSRTFLAMADSALDIRFVQALLLDSLYSEGLDNSSVHSALTGEAVALTLTTGMHRCGDDLWEMGPIVSEERKRFFWALWNYEKAAAVTLGRPPLIRLADVNTPLPEEVEDYLITSEGIFEHPEGRRSIPRLALRHVACWDTILEQLLDVSSLSQDVSAPEDAPTSFLYRLNHRITATRPSYPRIGLEEVEAAIADLELKTPEELRLPADLAFPKDTDEMTIVQAIRLEILRNHVKGLVAREKLAQEVRGSISTNGVHSVEMRTPSRPAMDGKEYCSMVVRLYCVLQKRGVLSTYFGVHHIHQLQNAGITFLAIICLYPDYASECSANLDLIIGILTESAQRWQCAVRAIDVLQTIALGFHVPLKVSGSPSTRPWMKLVPRRKSPSSSHSGHTSSTTRPTVQQQNTESDWDWLTSTAEQGLTYDFSADDQGASWSEDFNSLASFIQNTADISGVFSPESKKPTLEENGYINASSEDVQELASLLVGEAGSN